MDLTIQVKLREGFIPAGGTFDMITVELENG
jgi:hypothetical protein